MSQQEEGEDWLPPESECVLITPGSSKILNLARQCCWMLHSDWSSGVDLFSITSAPDNSAAADGRFILMCSWLRPLLLTLCCFELASCWWMCYKRDIIPLPNPKRCGMSHYVCVCVSVSQESERLEVVNAELKSQIEELKQERQRLVHMLNRHRPTCIVRTDSTQTPESENNPLLEQISPSWDAPETRSWTIQTGSRQTGFVEFLETRHTLDAF